jgi:hypothetical protein
VVEQPAWAADHDIGTFEGLDLGIDPHAAINHGAAQTSVAPQGPDGLMNLFGQFAGGGDDQRTDPASRTVHQPV